MSQPTENMDVLVPSKKEKPTKVLSNTKKSKKNTLNADAEITKSEPLPNSEDAETPIAHR